MNERAVELYKQAVTFAYNTAGKDAGKGTIIESLTAGKFAELIVQECAEIAKHHLMNISTYADAEFVEKQIEEHFGVKE